MVENWCFHPNVSIFAVNLKKLKVIFLASAYELLFTSLLFPYFGEVKKS